MCQTILVIFCKISMREKWQIKPAERGYIFSRFVTFLQVIDRKKCSNCGRKYKKANVKQNAKNTESKIFIAFI